MSTKEKIPGRKLMRLKKYDYSNAGWYFVTICTKNHIPYFGRIKKREMQKNELGKIAEKYWKETPAHYQETKLDEYIIMPNHIHGIIIIENPDVGTWPALSQPDKKHTLSDIVGSYKSAVSKYAHEHNIKNFHWQRSFHDHIIRNEKELFYIRRYIQRNPLKWELEKNIDNLER